ncbi:hypothetical protein GN330_13055 [Nitratireductor sp. CAU 1489]|uniref:Carboxymuconolactone decarboxylase-like domain-containing protein n=1 Tax=Nitratireductor arenosus TaxID=2682096 RepID=A0A844QFP1_9HYPH|nr:hypothetical protein [Nitratireductor arenosus]MVA98172.1 hypothetical protein [Nitratireductor arenosus]
MIKALLRRLIDSFERKYDYDSGYMREIVTADTAAGFKLMLASQFLTHDFGAPKQAYHAAKIRSAMRADCGPCLGLAAAMAQEDGADRDTVLAALGHGEADATVALAVRLADGVCDNAVDLPETVAKIRARFGERAAAGLAVAVMAGQFYPLLKRGMGQAAACEPVLTRLLAGSGEDRGSKTTG